MRIYNGCPDSTLQKIINQRASELKKFKKTALDKFGIKVHLTWFPAEAKWVAFSDKNKILSGMYDKQGGAIQEALINMAIK